MEDKIRREGIELSVFNDLSREGKDTGPYAVQDGVNSEQKEYLEDPLTRGRHVWNKGRFEFMGGFPVYVQGQGIPGYEENQRHCNGFASNVERMRDPVANDLGVDYTEQ